MEIWKGREEIEESNDETEDARGGWGGGLGKQELNKHNRKRSERGKGENKRKIREKKWIRLYWANWVII